MTPVSLICPYYEDSRFLFEFIWNENIFEYFDELIVVDDGSFHEKAKPLLVDLLLDEPNLKDRIRLFRIPTDYGFNAHGARNLAMNHVRNDWCLLIDVDIELTKGFCENLHASIETCPDDAFLVCNSNIVPDKDTLNHFAIRVDHFWDVGGYDEELMGFHFGDMPFRNRLDSAYKPIRMKPPPLKFKRGMHKYEYTNDLSMIEYNRDKVTMKHPSPYYQDLICKYLYERNDDRRRWKEIRDQQGRFYWYEEDLECHQLELDLVGTPGLKLKVPIESNPYFSLLKHLCDIDNKKRS